MELPEVKPQSVLALGFGNTVDGAWSVEDICHISGDRLLVASWNRRKRSQTRIYVIKADINEFITLYSRQFTEDESSARYVSEMDTSHMITCCGSRINILKMQQDLLMTSEGNLNPGHVANCITFNASSSEVFVGVFDSNEIYVFNKDLKIVRIIKLDTKRGKEFVTDITSLRDRLIVCTSIKRENHEDWKGKRIPVVSGSRILYLQSSNGKIVNTFHNPVLRNYGEIPHSVCVNSNTNNLYISWRCGFISLHSLINDDGPCISVIKTNICVTGITTDNNNMIWTNYWQKEEINIFHMNSCYNIENVKSTLGCVLSKDDCKRVCIYLRLPSDEASSNSIIHQLDVTKLLDAFRTLHMDIPFHLITGYSNYIRTNFESELNASSKKNDNLQKEIENVKRELEEVKLRAEAQEKELEDNKQKQQQSVRLERPDSSAAEAVQKDDIRDKDTAGSAANNLTSPSGTHITNEENISDTFGSLLVTVGEDLTLHHCIQLANIFCLPPSHLDLLERIAIQGTSGHKLFEICKERDIINIHNVTKLEEALKKLNLVKTLEKVTTYQNKIRSNMN